MTNHVKCASIILVLVVVSAHAENDQNFVKSDLISKAGLYEDGMRSYKNGDCPSAIKLLGEYQKLHEFELTKHKDFNKQIERAIEDCKSLQSNGGIKFETKIPTRNESVKGTIN